MGVLDILKELKLLEEQGAIGGGELKKLWKRTLSEGPAEDIIERVFSIKRGGKEQNANEEQINQEKSGEQEIIQKQESRSSTRVLEIERKEIPASCIYDKEEKRYGWLKIEEICYWGPCASSKSGEWLLGYSDCSIDEEKIIIGHRESGMGRFVLYNLFQQKIILDGRIPRPNSGEVADNGFFSIEDWGFRNYSGVFYVISPNGEVVIEKNLRSNILNSSISDNGRFAICQTANGGGDENKLIAFDVIGKCELFSVNNKVRWAERYEFNEDKPYFVLVLSNLGKFKFDAKGNFLDSEKYDNARLKCKEYHIVLEAAEELLKKENPDQKTAQKVLDSIQRIYPSIRSNDSTRLALAQKLQGLAYEILDNPKDALDSFEEALRINPKIGVKRKIAALRKQQG